MIKFKVHISFPTKYACVKFIIPKFQSHIYRNFKCFPVTEHVILLAKVSPGSLIRSVNAELIILGQITENKLLFKP